MLEFAFGISIAINVILFIAMYVVFKILRSSRKKNILNDEIVDVNIMKDFFGSDKL